MTNFHETSQTVEDVAWLATLHGYTMQDIVQVEYYLPGVIKCRRVTLYKALQSLEKKLNRVPGTEGVDFRIILK